MCISYRYTDFLPLSFQQLFRKKEQGSFSVKWVVKTSHPEDQNVQKVSKTELSNNIDINWLK